MKKIIAFETLIQQKINMRFGAQWIKSHQDKGTIIKQLPYWAQLNYKADQLATLHHLQTPPQSLSTVPKMPTALA